MHQETVDCVEEVRRWAPGDKVMKQACVVAALTNYVDAAFMIDMMETHGYPLIDQVIKLRSEGIDKKIPYLELEIRLLRLGKSASSAQSMLAEVRQYDAAVSKETK